MKLTELASQLKPYVVGWITDVVRQLTPAPPVEPRLAGYLTRREANDPGISGLATDTLGVGEINPGELGSVLKLWLKADTITDLADGDAVATWRDASGNGNDAAEGTNRPTYQTSEINGLPAVRFDGVNDRLLVSGMPTGVHTLFLVLKMNALDDAYSGIVGFNSAADYGGFFMKSSGKTALYPRNATTFYNAWDGTGVATIDTTAYHIITNIATFATAPRGYVDGVLDVTGNTAAAMVLSTNWEIGNHIAAGRFASMDVAEIIICDGAVTDAQRFGIELYLARKYALSMGNGVIQAGVVAALRTVKMHGGQQNAIGCAFTSTASATVGNTASETSLIGAGVGVRGLPPNHLIAGRTIRITAWGYHSEPASPIQMALRVKLNATVVATAVLTDHNSSNTLWRIECDITCRTTGASGTVQAQGLFEDWDSASNLDAYAMVATGTVAIDTTIAQTVGLTMQWASANAGATMTCTNVTVEVLN